MTDLYVLLVEDNRDDEELALWSLGKAGLTHVTVAHDGLEALTLLFGSPPSAGQEPFLPDILLLDLRLPKIDGLEVLKQLRSNERTKMLKVFALSSSEDPQDKKICSDLGVIAFLSKPLEREKLLPYL
ncbi:response regulator [Geobacter argillaceus]|uniref:Response regulator receiver domain-containing protein n=1 Tax=Geobacter argillaceus TaxID=345631 RepID=A0A562VKE8_9BACT|nr:response regulator [Geobacter argillaceus]TWJ18254.1 response regulator receiver domain-containing protein [Geobacter argillaceus]